MTQILSNENQDLLKIILDNQPKSLKELEQLTGRVKSNLSRTLKTLKRYGIVVIHQQRYKSEHRNYIFYPEKPTKDHILGI